MISTYCDYINKYVLQPHRRAKGDVPGEHHFVSVYLLPRLSRFPFLPVPHYVNPDGQKFVTGDVVYYNYEAEKVCCYKPSHLLSIEVKLENPHDGWIKLTRNQYYCWIRKECPPDQEIKIVDVPDCFIAVSAHGIAVMPWEQFRPLFISTVYSDGLRELPKKKGRPTNTKPFRMSGLQWNTSCFCFPYSAAKEDWEDRERRFLECLETRCREIVKKDLMPLEVCTDLPPAAKRRKKATKQSPAVRPPIV
jgi:hypothetical protein